MANFRTAIVLFTVLMWGFTSCNDQERNRTQTETETAMAVSEDTVGTRDWNSEEVKEHVNDWKETPKGVAQEMIDKYGTPDEVTDERLIWHDNGDFAMTILTNEEIDHDFPMPHKDCLLQVVNYEVPVEKYSDMARYDGSVILERTKGTMGARCDKEMANYLALNLAHDVAQGNKSVDEARQYYTETIMAVMNGEEPEYTQKLIFDPVQNAGFADEPSIPEEKRNQMK